MTVPSAYLQVLIKQPQLPVLEAVVLFDEELLLGRAGGLAVAGMAVEGMVEDGLLGPTGGGQVEVHPRRFPLVPAALAAVQ